MSLDKGLVWITGASSGIGWATSIHLARNGYEVIASARNLKALRSLCKKHLNIHIFPLDVADPLEREAVYDEIRQDYGPIDVLINNAGYGLRGAVEDVPAHMTRDIFDVNVHAPIELTKLVLPEMRQRREGRILMVSSVVGRVTFPLSGTYSATKHAIKAYSDALRLELAPWSIKVVQIEPGPIRTNFGTNAKSQSDTLLKDSKSPYFKHYNHYLDHPPFKPHEYWGPASVADVILKAIESPNPKSRYPVHPAASILPFLRSHLPAALVDRMAAEKYGFTAEDAS